MHKAAKAAKAARLASIAVMVGGKVRGVGRKVWSLDITVEVYHNEQKANLHDLLRPDCRSTHGAGWKTQWPEDVRENSVAADTAVDAWEDSLLAWLAVDMAVDAREILR